MAIGFHREPLTRQLRRLPAWPYMILSGVLLLGLIDLHGSLGALNELFPGATPQALGGQIFSKSALGAGRLVASAIVFQFAYLVATLFWKPIRACLGWLLLPLGQNSLYCYSMHVVVIGLFYSLLPRLSVDVLAMGLLNTCVQVLVVLVIWKMAERQILFKVVPR